MLVAGRAVLVVKKMAGIPCAHVEPRTKRIAIRNVRGPMEEGV